jgi:hypothetical protein
MQEAQLEFDVLRYLRLNGHRDSCLVALCHARGHLGPQEFEAVMSDQMRLYTQACLPAASLPFKANHNSVSLKRLNVHDSNLWLILTD